MKDQCGLDIEPGSRIVHMARYGDYYVMRKGTVTGFSSRKVYSSLQPVVLYVDDDGKKHRALNTGRILVIR